MNEKIKALVIAALAAVPYKEMEQPLSSSVEMETVVIPLAFAEKFAELIVRECVEVITDTTGDSEWDGYNQATAMTVMDNFKNG